MNNAAIALLALFAGGAWWLSQQNKPTTRKKKSSNGTATPSPTPTPTPTPSPTPTPTPDPTPQPGDIAASGQAQSGAGQTWDWQVVHASDPAKFNAQYRLISGQTQLNWNYVSTDKTDPNAPIKSYADVPTAQSDVENVIANLPAVLIAGQPTGPATAQPTPGPITSQPAPGPATPQPADAVKPADVGLTWDDCDTMKVDVAVADDEVVKTMRGYYNNLSSFNKANFDVADLANAMVRDFVRRAAPLKCFKPNQTPANSLYGIERFSQQNQDMYDTTWPLAAPTREKYMYWWMMVRAIGALQLAGHQYTVQELAATQQALTAMIQPVNDQIWDDTFQGTVSKPGTP